MRSLLIALAISTVGLVSPANAQAPAPAAVPSQVDKVQNPVLKKEVKALEEAAALMEAVSDEESAKKAAIKIRNLFRSLPPPTSGSQADLEIWARAQNRFSAQMWRIIKEPYFQSQKMQEIWTLVTDPYSRKGSVPK